MRKILVNALTALGAFSYLAMGPSAAHAVAVSGQGTWETTLQPRYFFSKPSDKPLAYYDTVLDVTWQATITEGSVPSVTEGGWRPPKLNGETTCPPENWGYCFVLTHRDTELTHMFDVTLGNTPAQYDEKVKLIPGTGLTNSGPFDFSVATRTNTDGFNKFDLSSGYGYYPIRESGVPYIWFVHDGDVGSATPVPEPSSWILFLSPLLAVYGVASRLSNR